MAGQDGSFTHHCFSGRPARRHGGRHLPDRWDAEELARLVATLGGQARVEPVQQEPVLQPLLFSTHTTVYSFLSFSSWKFKLSIDVCHINIVLKIFPTFYLGVALASV